MYPLTGEMFCLTIMLIPATLALCKWSSTQLKTSLKKQHVSVSYWGHYQTLPSRSSHHNVRLPSLDVVASDDSEVLLPKHVASWEP